MKIAVTYEGGEVFQHFGRTEQFKVFDVENGKILNTQIYGCNGVSHGAVAEVLINLGVDVLICGGIGMGARNRVVNLGIQLVSGITGNADLAVESYLNGKIGSNPDAGVHECHGH